MPHPARQVAGIARAAIGEILAVARGAGPVTPEESARRLSVCRGCEHFALDSGRCSQCGCYIRIKIGWRDQTCPADKW